MVDRFVCVLVDEQQIVYGARFQARPALLNQVPGSTKVPLATGTGSRNTKDLLGRRCKVGELALMVLPEQQQIVPLIVWESASRYATSSSDSSEVFV